MGSGVDELSAVTDLAVTLEERARADAFSGIEQRGRLAFVAGAEEESRKLGRPLTDKELQRVVTRIPNND
jgi:hypothetical protein